MTRQIIKHVLVSILMPAYNGERFIEQAIDSVLGQTYKNWELIVIDDGSTDSTPDLVATYKDPRVRYQLQTNQGQAAALNHGLRLAQGDLVTTLDVDDWYTPNSLEDRVSFLVNHSEYGVVYGDGVYCDVDGKYLRCFSQHRIGDVVGDVYDTLIATPFFGTGGNVMVRRDIIERNNLQYDETIFWCQDWDFYVRLAELTHFGYFDSVTIWYRLHQKNMTYNAEFKDNRLNSLIRFRNKILDSKRFSQLSSAQKYAFFRFYLLGDIAFRKDDQDKEITSSQFKALPKNYRSQILRLIATDYLLESTDYQFAKRLLKRAWLLNPIDVKTGFVALFSVIDPELAASTIQFWRKSTNEQIKNDPLDLMIKRTA